jgi:hypothetical protein
MNYRKATMLTAESIASAGVKTLDFKIKDIMSRIMIQTKCMNTSGTPTAHPASVVSKIEIVDGSDVLWSLTGKQASALNFYSNGRPAVDAVTYVNDINQWQVFNINFGRWLFDEDLAFDPTRFNNPQLKITHNLAAGGIAPDAGTLEIVAEVFDELKPAPVGWLMAKEYHSYTPEASAYKYIDMPTDYPLRAMYLQYLYGGQAPQNGIYEVKLSEDNDKKIPFDDLTYDLLKYNLDQFGRYEEDIVATTSTSPVTHYVTPSYLTHIFGNDNIATNSYVFFGQSYGGTVTIDASAAGVVRARASGYCPHGVMPFMFGDKWMPEKWYDVTKLGSLELRLKADATVGGTAQVITEQLRRY